MHRTACLTAVLGPTNTGKTHLAVERMCGHTSGIIGFPLRLLAREVYDQVALAKGPDQVALITGEEKIIPPTARYFLCTAESMPVDRDVAFVALDEAQVGIDEERGHVFTDRLLHARGRAETMILGSDALRPLISRLLPKAEVISRPRFSTLRYTQPKKLSRLPKRSAIVCFSVEEVYALAEMLRRQRGGAAVVMGALSPRTRNAQVALFQSGEVDYLVATDAIGMGLNMDINHVAFASLHKFDGKRQRKLSLLEMGQIAGRAGRHQRDGTFGLVHLSQAQSERGFDAQEVLALEEHAYPALTELRWRNTKLDFASLTALVGSLCVRPQHTALRRTDETVDLAVLRRLQADPESAARAHTEEGVRRLWSACQIPDYRKIGSEQHARLVSKIFFHLSEGSGQIPVDWIAMEVARLDHVQGDIDTLAGRIAAVRTWAYVAHHADWLEDPQGWSERTRCLEDKLSDALHEKLTQRFVDRRTSVLMGDVSRRGGVHISETGAVRVGGEPIGQLEGFTFTVDPDVRYGQKRMAMAAADRALVHELDRRAQALSTNQTNTIALGFAPPAAPIVLWDTHCVACLKPGQSWLTPQVVLPLGAAGLADASRNTVAVKLSMWVQEQIERYLRPLVALHALTGPRGGLSPAGRGLAVQLVEDGGCVPLARVRAQVAALSAADKTVFRRLGVRLGVVHVFIPAVLKPEAVRWRLALWSLHHARGVEGAMSLCSGRPSLAAIRGLPPSLYAVAGYWLVGDTAVRVDMIERLVKDLWVEGKTRRPFVPTERAVSWVGLKREDFAEVMKALGYRPVRPSPAPEKTTKTKTPLATAFVWKGLAPPKADRPHHIPLHSPFSVLSDWKPAAP